MLVHGAYADGSCWADVIARLQAAGPYDRGAEPADLAGRDVQATRRILALQDEPDRAGRPLVGREGDQRGRRPPDVVGLVYVAARPRRGRGLTPRWPSFPTPPASAGLVCGRVRQSQRGTRSCTTSPASPGGARALRGPGPHLRHPVRSTTTVAAWRSTPSWYAVSTNDRTTSPEFDRFLAKRMKGQNNRLVRNSLSLITSRTDHRADLHAARHAWRQPHRSGLKCSTSRRDVPCR